MWNLAILENTFLEKIHLKPSLAAFWRYFRDNFRPDVASNVISFENVGADVIFGRSLSVNNFRREVGNDVISCAFIDLTGGKAAVKYGGSRVNPSRDTRLPHFVTNDNDRDDYNGGVRRASHKDKRLLKRFAW